LINKYPILLCTLSRERPSSYGYSPSWFGWFREVATYMDTAWNTSWVCLMSSDWFLTDADLGFSSYIVMVALYPFLQRWLRTPHDRSLKSETHRNSPMGPLPSLGHMWYAQEFSIRFYWSYNQWIHNFNRNDAWAEIWYYELSPYAWIAPDDLLSS